jgi:iron complex outermembrane receptor protein
MGDSMTSRTKLTASAAILAAITPLTSAQAQNITLEEIVVTAERRETSLQSTPIAVTALSSVQLERFQITETLDLVRHVPNLVGFNNVTLGASNSYFLRGIGSAESIATFDPPIGTYIDDIFVARQNANNIDLVEVERIEVLRGPQGTLFGRNTTGGAVSIITKKPSEDFYVKGEVGYGRFNEIRGKVAFNIPISDKVFTSLSSYYIKDDGWQRSIVTDETYNGKEAFGVRGAVRVMPSDNVTWDLSGDWSTQDHQNLQSIVDRAAAPTNLSAGSSGPWELGTPRLNGVYLKNCKTGNEPRDWVRNGCTANEVTGYNLTSKLSVEMDSFGVEIITGYRNLNHDFVSPLFGSLRDGFELPLINDGDHNQFSQEVKFAGDALDGRLQWTTGVFYMKEDNFTQFETSLSSPALGVFLVLDDNTMENDTESFAWYAQTDWEVVDRLTITTGVRWTDEKKTVPFFFHTNSAGVEFDIQDITAAGNPDASTAIQWTPRLAASYQVNDDMMLFASATRGFKSGGWNARTSSARLFTRFEEETVWSYEVGTRAEFFDNRLRTNITLFDATFSDLQLPSLAFTPAPGEAPTFVNNNAGESNIRGAEFEIAGQITEEFSVFANVGLADGKFNSFTPGAIVAGFSPDTIPERNPNFTIQAGINYDTFVDSLNGNVNLSADVVIIDDYPSNPQNNLENFVEGYETVNASIGYETEDGLWGVQLGCKNCLDEQYWTTHFIGARFIGDPMRWSLSVKFNYN